MHVILMGAQGAGKGTQAARVAPLLNLVHLSTGDLFRAAISSGSELGVLAKGYLDRGELVPDDVTVGIVARRLDEIKAGGVTAGALFDGFPRTPGQAAALDQALAERKEAIAAVVELHVPHDVLAVRLSGRRVCSQCGATYHVDFAPTKVEGVCDKCGGQVIQRADDTPDAIRRRLDLYAEQTAPLLAYYQAKGLLRVVDGDRPVDKVTNDILAAVPTDASRNT